MAAVYQVPGSGAVEFENDGELENLAIPHFSVGTVEAQEAAAPPAGTYEGYSFVGLPV
jgi:hypothetical protein